MGGGGIPRDVRRPMDKSSNVESGDAAQACNTKVPRSLSVRSFHQSRETVWRWRVQILRTNVRGVWIPLTLLLLNCSVRRVTRLIALVLALGLVSSSACKVPFPATVPVPTSVPLCMLTISKPNLHKAPTKSWNAEPSRITLALKRCCIAA